MYDVFSLKQFSLLLFHFLSILILDYLLNHNMSIFLIIKRKKNDIVKCCCSLYHASCVWNASCIIYRRTHTHFRMQHIHVTRIVLYVKNVSCCVSYFASMINKMMLMAWAFGEHFCACVSGILSIGACICVFFFFFDR